MLFLNEKASKVYLVLCVAGFLTFGAFSLANGLNAATLPFAHGVVVSETGVVFVAHVPNGIDAIDLAQGKILWHSDDADRPLAFWNSKLVAFKKTGDTSFVTVLLDSHENARVVLTSESVMLPDWCTVAAENNSDFATTADVVDDHLQMRIDARGMYDGGANPSKSIVAKYSQQQSWVAEIDLRSGRVKLSEAEQTKKPDASILSDSVLIGGKRLEIVTTKTEQSESTDSFHKDLRALDSATGKTLWQTAVGKVDVPHQPKLPQ
jgi:outer membrane protein assembly factor BamB